MKAFLAGILALSTLAAVNTASAQNKPAKKNTPSRVLIRTNYGDMVVRLYDNTPKHRDNFMSKVKEHFYDSLLFHRVINGFMIQGGDPTSKNAQSTDMLGSGSAPGDRIPAEFRPELFHKKGALAAARDNNPEKASSNCQFYIVQGRPTADDQLNQTECNVRQQGNMAFRYSDAQRKTYGTLGGTPFLDQNYTVFGEVELGLEVVDRIAATQTGAQDRPVADVRMSMKPITEAEFQALKQKMMKAAKKK